MNGAELRSVLALRALETQPPPAAGVPMPAAWTPADHDWATRESLREGGVAQSADEFIVRRARIAAMRWSARPGADPLRVAVAEPPRAGLALALGCAAAFVLGLVANAIGPDGRINLLAPPLLALLAWNLLVYLGLAVHTVSGFFLRTGSGPVVDAAGTDARASDGDAAGSLPGVGRLRGALLGWWARRPHVAEGGPGTAMARAAASVAVGWWQAHRRTQVVKLAMALHLAAACLAAGAVAALYLRGLAFEFRAGWDSTFLDAPAVHALLGIVLGPAAALTGHPLPSVAGYEALNFGAGSNGERAAWWIHWHAITIALFVIVPRLLLAARDAWLVRFRAQRLALPDDEAYFGPLRQALEWARTAGDEPVTVRMLPVELRLSAPEREAAQLAMVEVTRRRLRRPARLSWAEADRVREAVDGDVAWSAVWPDREIPAAVALVFRLGTTPEREVHGEAVRSLREALPDGMDLWVLVDESAWRAHFGVSSGPDGGQDERLGARRASWQRLLADVDASPEFIELQGQAREVAA